MKFAQPMRAATLVIADGRGRPIHRWQLPAGANLGLAAAAGGLLLAVLLILCHLAVLGPTLRELSRGRRHNLQLAQELDLLQAALPAARARAASAEAACGRAWAHSGMGRPAPLAPPGPRPAPGASSPASDLQLAGRLQQRLRAVRGAGGALHARLGEAQQTLFDRQQLRASTPSIRPADSPWTSSSFGPRLDPLTGGWMMHKGLDLAGPTGSAIIAPADGTVIWTGWRGGYGKTVVIDHGYALQTHFAHLDAYDVRAGQRVRRGQPIARMGSTGRSTGSHLHYEVRRAGQPLDPRLFILD